jgi:hypothetical protein
MSEGLWGRLKSWWHDKETILIGKSDPSAVPATPLARTESVKDGATLFAELERTMPLLLAKLRQDLAAHPLRRDVLVRNTKVSRCDWREDHVLITKDEHPKIWKELRVLVSRGLITELKFGFAYRLSEQFVGYLTAR